MEMFYLIVKLGYASVIIPEKYNKAQCEQVVKDSKNWNTELYCIPAPSTSYCTQNIPNTSYNITVPCGTPVTSGAK